jgi:hypothetical protein
MWLDGDDSCSRLLVAEVSGSAGSIFVPCWRRYAPRPDEAWWIPTQVFCCPIMAPATRRRVSCHINRTLPPPPWCRVQIASMYQSNPPPPPRIKRPTCIGSLRAGIHDIFYSILTPPGTPPPLLPSPHSPQIRTNKGLDLWEGIQMLLYVNNTDL